MNKCCEKCGNSKGERGKSANAKKILFVGAEVMPFAATGGLGDVLGSLPAALNERGNGGVEVRVVIFGTLHSDAFIFPFRLCFLLLFFSQLFVRPPQTAILLFCISFPWGWS